MKFGKEIILKVRKKKIYAGCQDASLSIIDLENKNNNIDSFYSSSAENGIIIEIKYMYLK